MFVFCEFHKNAKPWPLKGGSWEIFKLQTLANGYGVMKVAGGCMTDMFTYVNINTYALYVAIRCYRSIITGDLESSRPDRPVLLSPRGVFPTMDSSPQGSETRSACTTPFCCRMGRSWWSITIAATTWRTSADGAERISGLIWMLCESAKEELDIEVSFDIHGYVLCMYTLCICM